MRRRFAGRSTSIVATDCLLCPSSGTGQDSTVFAVESGFPRIFPLHPFSRTASLLAGCLARRAVFRRRIAHAVVRRVADVEHEPPVFGKLVHIHTANCHLAFLLSNDFDDRATHMSGPASRIRRAYHGFIIQPVGPLICTLSDYRHARADRVLICTKPDAIVRRFRSLVPKAHVERPWEATTYEAIPQAGIGDHRRKESRTMAMSTTRVAQLEMRESPP
ncbi:hypothetical protein WJ542_13800 [Paraburkholderia sp. B3]|uniref:hypothetical protein n=1 Tax=Paraburkholderia sp. B3 TaxID=3134791 RepID=UPI0039822797